MIIAGWTLLVFGALATVAMVASMFSPSPKSSLATDISATIIFGNIPLVAGVLLVRAGRVQRRRKLIESSERQLLAIARNHSGKLTATLVAMETPLSIDEAREILEMFVTRGVVDMIVDDNGVVLYYFRELMVDNS